MENYELLMKYYQLLLARHKERIRRDKLLKKWMDRVWDLYSELEKANTVVTLSHICSAHIGITQDECPVCKGNRIQEENAKLKELIGELVEEDNWFDDTGYGEEVALAEIKHNELIAKAKEILHDLLF